MYVVFMCLRVCVFQSSGFYLLFLPESSLPLVNSPILHTLRPLFWKDELQGLKLLPSCEGF